MYFNKALTPLISAFALHLSFGAATPLDDYIMKPESVYAWRDLNASFGTLLGGTAYAINVTSQTWLDTSRAKIVVGDHETSVWSHQVIVVVPKTIKYTNVSMAYVTGGCNGDALPKKTDEELLILDELTHATGTVGIIVYQIPNCPIVYPNDPQLKKRGEDAMLAWAWKNFMDIKPTNHEWIPRLPMAKAVFQCLKAANDFMKQKSFADVKGWVVSGASKRGWTTWMVGAATCESCEEIVGLAPLVPIVPALHEELHRQWKAYGGWTFAFKDYTDANITGRIDDPIFTDDLLKTVDPSFYGERLARLPKVVVLSSDDEFMMMDWSNIWYDDLTGERHLMIANNAEHSLATGIPEVLSCLGTFLRSIAAGRTERPDFNYEYNETDGSITVSFDPNVKHGKVVLRHASTMQSKMRDFRWVKLSSNDTSPCKFPAIPLKKPVFGGNCLQPIVWTGETIKADADGKYRAVPPTPKDGKWTGYYVEVYFPSDTTGSDYQFTTPGYTFPNTLPFPDCHGSECTGKLV